MEDARGGRRMARGRPQRLGQRTPHRSHLVRRPAGAPIAELGLVPLGGIPTVRAGLVAVARGQLQGHVRGGVPGYGDGEAGRRAHRAGIARGVIRILERSRPVVKEVPQYMPIGSAAVVRLALGFKEVLVVALGLGVTVENRKAQRHMKGRVKASIKQRIRLKTIEHKQIFMGSNVLQKEMVGVS